MRCGLRWRTPWKRFVLLVVFVGGVFFICNALAVGTLIALDGPFSWSQQIGSKWATLVAFLVGWVVPGAVIVAIPKGWLGPICDDLCKNCGYDLRGIESEVCPECGTSVERKP